MAHFAKINNENKVLNILYIEDIHCLDENGNEIESPTPEQLAQLQNDVATKLAPKFNDFRLEFDEDEDAPEKNVAAFQVPLSSFVSFVANVVFKK